MLYSSIKPKTKQIIATICAAMLCLFFVFSIGAVGFQTVSAAVEYTDYEKSSIEYDLKTIGEELFDPLAYPKDENGKHRLLDNVGFMEYAYSTSAILKNYYGVYFYIYNPTEKEVSTRDGANVVNMATEYRADGEPSSYENVAIQLLSATVNNRFLKFGIVNKQGLYDRARAYAGAHEGVRRYDIAGIQIWFKGDQNATDANTERDAISYTYLCTGYCAGCSPDGNEEGTLNVERKQLETLELDVRHTAYRPEGTNGKTQYTHDSLNSIYFAVPKATIEKYGEMTGIKGKYLRALTGDIFVTGSEKYYKMLEPYIGVDVGTYSEGDDFKFLAGSKDAEKLLGMKTYTSWGYHMSDAMASVNSGAKLLTKLNYVIKAKNGNADEYTVSPEILEKYMKDYTAKFPIDESQLVGGKFHPDLFAEVDEEETIFDFNDESLVQRFQVQTITQDWWERLWGKQSVSDMKFLEEGQKKVIQKLTDADFVNVTDKKAFSRSLYVGESDVQDIYDYYEEHKQDYDIYITRFAVDDYAAAEAVESVYYEGFLKDLLQWNFKDGSVYDKQEADTNCYFAQEYAYLNFELIETRYTLGEIEKVIPVVMSPMDIIPGLTPPSITTKDGINKTLVVVLVCLAGGVTAVGVIYYVVRYKLERRRGGR